MTVDLTPHQAELLITVLVAADEQLIGPARLVLRDLKPWRSALVNRYFRERAVENERASMGGVGNGKQGFASMDPKLQKALASKGGKKAHALGKAHEWDSDAARIAGSKGGKASAGKARKPVAVVPES